MTRSVWKGPFVDSHLLKKVKAAPILVAIASLRLGLEDQLYYPNLWV